MTLCWRATPEETSKPLIDHQIRGERDSEVDEADDKVQLTTFNAGLKSREFVVSLAKNPPKTMMEMLLKAQKYMKAEDALVAIKDEEKTGEKGRKKDDRKG